MTLTDKQKDIIKTINLGHERGHLLDLDELLEVLPYRTTKAVYAISPCAR